MTRRHLRCRSSAFVRCVSPTRYGEWGPVWTPCRRIRTTSQQSSRSSISGLLRVQCPTGPVNRISYQAITSRSNYVTVNQLGYLEDVLLAAHANSRRNVRHLSGLGVFSDIVHPTNPDFACHRLRIYFVRHAYNMPDACMCVKRNLRLEAKKMRTLRSAVIRERIYRSSARNQRSVNETRSLNLTA